MPTILTVYDSDERLAEALQMEDKEALSILYDRYAPALLGVLQKITGDTDSAEELLQESFIRIWRDKESYNSSKEKLFTWLFRIAKDAANSSILSKAEKTKNQHKELYVSTDNSDKSDPKNIKLIMDMIILGSISQEDAAARMGVSIPELRVLLRKEINNLRGISAA